MKLCIYIYIYIRELVTEVEKLILVFLISNVYVKLSASFRGGRVPVPPSARSPPSGCPRCVTFTVSLLFHRSISPATLIGKARPPPFPVRTKSFPFPLNLRRRKFRSLLDHLRSSHLENNITKQSRCFSWLTHLRNTTISLSHKIFVSFKRFDQFEIPSKNNPNNRLLEKQSRQFP